MNLSASSPELLTGILLLRPANVVGVPALKGLLDTRPEALPLPVTGILYTPENLSLSGLVDDIARSEHGLIMLMNKGGVEKTMVVATIAVRLIDMKSDVYFMASDPVAYLSTTLSGSLKSLQVSRISPHDKTKRYRQHALETKEKDLDEIGERLPERDLRSPCTEEIVVFQAFSRMIREAGKRFVVIDAVPTGHTLLLLDAIGAYHQEIIRKMGSEGHSTTPTIQLQDPGRTRVLLAMLPEAAPVLETADLQADLERVRIYPWSWTINNGLSVVGTRSPLLYQRARQRRPQIEVVKSQHTEHMAFILVLASEPIDIRRLGELMG